MQYGDEAWDISIIRADLLLSLDRSSNNSRTSLPEFCNSLLKEKILPIL